MMFYPTTVHAEEEDTTTLMGHRAPKQRRTTGRSVGRMMALVVGLALLLVADGAVVMPEEKEEGAWSDADSTTRSAAAAATATAAAEEGVVMTEDIQETPSSRHYDFAAAAGEDVGTEDGSRTHELTPRRADAAAVAAAATTQRRRKIAKKTHEVLSGGSDCAKDTTTACPQKAKSGYRIIMAASGKTFTDASCPDAGSHNDYWMYWSDEEHNRPHSTLTKKKGYGIAGSLTLNDIDKEIKLIASGSKYANSTERYRIKYDENFTLKTVSGTHPIKIAKYKSATVTTVSNEIIKSKALGKVPSMTLETDLHFTLGYIKQYTTDTKFNALADCLRSKKGPPRHDQYMDLVIQNIDSRCWCKIHSLNDRKK